MHVQAAASVLERIERPFKGLAQYKRDDPCPLFARDKDVELIESRLWSSRVTVMFAGSGVGKTSFLNARLIPALENIFGPTHVAAPDPHSWARVDPRKELAAARERVSAGPSTRRGGIIILDQFEELFQHFPSPALLREFGEELSATVDEDSSFNVRLLISIREEFLADLTSLDDFLPGVLTNYYRLRRLSTREAKFIIENTAALAGVTTDERVDQLVKDLCALDRGQRRDAGVFVDPPYLQIVCQRVWNREKPSPTAPFLSSYQAGEAEHELEQYCREKLEPLSRRQAALVRKALEHLTGPHEAKKFRRVAELADEIGVREPAKLAAALDVLQEDDVKILRRWEESPTSTWAAKRPGQPRQVYQLYHDMYAPELWRWKEEQALIEWRRGLAKWLVVAAAVVFFALWPLTQRLLVSRAISLPYGHADEYAAVLDMRNAFGRTVLFREFGDRAWWRYTQKLKTLSALKGDNEAAIGYQLAGLAATARTAPDGATGFGPGQYLEGVLAGQRDIVDAALRKEQGKTQVILATSGGIVEWSPGDEPVAFPLSALQGVRPDASPIPVDVPAGPALGGSRVLCLSPDGSRALVAKVGSEQHIELGTYDLVKREIVGTPGVFSTASPVPSRGVRSASSDVSAIVVTKTYSDLEATSDASGQRFVVMADGVGVVYDTSTGTTTVVPRQGIRQMAFTNDGVAVASVEQFGYQLGVSFWALRDGKALPIPATISPTLRWDGRLIVRDGTHVLAANGNQWAWISPSDVKPQLLPFDAMPDPRQSFGSDPEVGTFAPRAFDAQRKMLLHSNVRGRLAFSSLDDQPERYAILPISERPSTALTRLTTEASVGRFGAGQLVTIDDVRTTARVWKIPGEFPVKVAVRKASPLPGVEKQTPDARDEPPSCGSQGGAFCSKDRQWVATVSPEGGKYSVRIAAFSSAAKSSVWSTTVSHEPRYVQISSSGTRIIALHDNGFTYADRSDALRPVRVPTAIKQAVFGPGEDHITILRQDNYLEIRDRRAIHDYEWQVPAATSGLTLVAKPNESSVLLFSRTWLHRLDPPSGLAKLMLWVTWNRHVWPNVDSVQAAAPIDLTQFQEQGKDLVLVQPVQNDVPVDKGNQRSPALGSQIVAGPWSLKQWWHTYSVEPCHGELKRTGGWREKLCDWERLSGRRAGDGLSR